MRKGLDMNDFTKQELHDLLMFSDKYTRDSPLFNKIQSLIDNYKCNHESDGLIYTSNPPKNKCVKCKEFY